ARRAGCRDGEAGPASRSRSCRRSPRSKLSRAMPQRRSACAQSLLAPVRVLTVQDTQREQRANGHDQCQQRQRTPYAQLRVHLDQYNLALVLHFNCFRRLFLLPSWRAMGGGYDGHSNNRCQSFATMRRRNPVNCSTSALLNPRKRWFSTLTTAAISFGRTALP